MKPLIIDRAELFVVGPDVARCRLAADMGEVYETLTLLRLHTACGLEGFAGVTTYSEHCFDESLGAALKPLLPILPGLDAWNSDAIWQQLMLRYNSMTPKPQSAIDIALWDLKAKALDLPLYRLLGGSRDSIRSYASTPVFDTPAEYVDFVHTLRAQGFDTVKFHVPCELSQDLALLDALDQAFGKELAFMVDLEERYSRPDAQRIARRLETMNCVWLEAPLIDTDLAGYAELRRNTSVPILPAGNTLLTPGLMNQGIEQQAWDALRTDVTYAGGFTATRTIAALAQAHSLPLELQSWGYTPSQAANLQMMLSIPNAVYFEQPVPSSSHEACCPTPIRTDNGRVHAPDGAGLGIEIDWQQVAKQALWHHRIGG
ncbi:mandelate racemase/muconate lactonizing enzyme family protein [Marinobacterium arenosum]|uniref:mandelate racemase/muconate lactonizing enzyme family protein n=1 Tax=Marinobacterium arenosum TaxID=2862496 RepID=UPI001C94BBBE|nr:mandelate racemase/muconate lactonizing enzyme family protein [Marinobacterium arenosum]MBY4677437.1 mandelate racemase/muconate lactonizing enzyme family protein [Marinobacterium arenosum]